jgi:hypothetical protein
MDSLEEGQRAKAAYAFADPERTRWHWTTPGNFPRNGLPLRDLAPEQRDRAMAYSKRSLTGGFKKRSTSSPCKTICNDPNYTSPSLARRVARRGWR